MPQPKKTKLGIGGTILVVVVVLAYKFLGGSDLLQTGTTPAGSQTGEQTASQRHDAKAKRMDPDQRQTRTAPKATPNARGVASDDDFIEQLFKQQRSDEIVTLAGVVSKTLSDDNYGDRHQRFVVKLGSGRTILIAHNIDLAPRVPLREGDQITIHGEYEWTEKGGTIHWTHHDPKKWREGGWIDHKGKRYE